MKSLFPALQRITVHPNDIASLISFGILVVFVVEFCYAADLILRAIIMCRAMFSMSSP